MKRLGQPTHLQPENRQTLAEAAEKIKAVLSLILGGDKVAAEYCLVSLISRVYKSEAAFMIGALPLNLTQITSEQAQLMQKFLMSLCPRLAIFESTVPSLNETCWQPKKSYETNRVCSSVLGELPILSNLVIDETCMEVGELKEQGINNLKAIGELIEDQKITFDFQYSHSEMKTNVAVLVLGNGRSMFKNTLQMVCQGSSFHSAEVKSKIAAVTSDSETMAQLRTAFTSLTYHYAKTTSDFNILADVGDHAQSVFVEMRKQEADAGGVKTDDSCFHRWLTLARYLTLLDGELNLTKELFDRALKLETNRVNRLPPAAKK